MVDPFDHVAAIGKILDSLEIPWVLGGSLASSIVGEPRSTVDVDIAVLIDEEQIDALVSRVEDDYYVSAEMAHDAAARGSSFNLLHFATGMKIDLFALVDDLLDRRQLERRMLVEVGGGSHIWVGAADDQVLRKLRWYQIGGEISDRQWRDVVSILKVQGDRIDRDELLAVADEAGLAELTRRAIADADARPF